MANSERDQEVLAWQFAARRAGVQGDSVDTQLADVAERLLHDEQTLPRASIPERQNARLGGGRDDDVTLAIEVHGANIDFVDKVLRVPGGDPALAGYQLVVSVKVAEFERSVVEGEPNEETFVAVHRE